MRISRILAGQLPFVRFDENPVRGLPPLPRPLSTTQIKMNVERARIAALPGDTSSPSRQTKRQFARAVAKAQRSKLTRQVGKERPYFPADWRQYL